MSLPDRFWAKVQPDNASGCWRWTSTIGSKGYAWFWVSPTPDCPGRSRQAHIVAYEGLVGPVPQGMVLDHVRALGCRHSDCVNPAHLEPVTPAENSRRSLGDRTHCKNGHRFEDDTYIRPTDGARICRVCARKRLREWRARKVTPSSRTPISTRSTPT